MQREYLFDPTKETSVLDGSEFPGDEPFESAVLF